MPYQIMHSMMAMQSLCNAAALGASVNVRYPASLKIPSCFCWRHGIACAVHMLHEWSPVEI